MKKIEFFKVEGDKINRIRKHCPKCGPAVFLADHKNRYSCGKCGYTEFKGGGKREPKPPKVEEKQVDQSPQEISKEEMKKESPESIPDNTSEGANIPVAPAENHQNETEKATESETDSIPATTDEMPDNNASSEQVPKSSEDSPKEEDKPSQKTQGDSKEKKEESG